MSNLLGRVALVTGATRGLGRAIAFGLADAGADVVITSRKLEACREVADEVEERTGRAALPYACHVGHWDELNGLADAAFDRFGKVDVLVNNVGISPVYDDILSITEDLWDKVFDVGVKGAFRLSALIGKRMVERGSGSIINISSGAAIRPTPDTIPYGAAKAALNNLTIGLAQTLAPKVRVNGIMAGPFRTDATRAWAADNFDAQARDFALRRLGEPDEIVAAALYYAGDGSSFTTGSILQVDGGMR